jgi:hypothetical protein
MTQNILTINVKDVGNQIDCRANLAFAIKIRDQEYHHLVSETTNTMRQMKDQKSIIRQLKETFRDLP